MAYLSFIFNNKRIAPLSNKISIIPPSLNPQNQGPERCEGGGSLIGIQGSHLSPLFKLAFSQVHSMFVYICFTCKVFTAPLVTRDSATLSNLYNNCLSLEEVALFSLIKIRLYLFKNNGEVIFQEVL